MGFFGHYFQSHYCCSAIISSKCFGERFLRFTIFAGGLFVNGHGVEHSLLLHYTQYLRTPFTITIANCDSAISSLPVSSKRRAIWNRRDKLFVLSRRWRRHDIPGLVRNIAARHPVRLRTYRLLQIRSVFARIERARRYTHVINWVVFIFFFLLPSLARVSRTRSFSGSYNTRTYLPTVVVVFRLPYA